MISDNVLYQGKKQEQASKTRITVQKSSPKPSHDAH